MEIFEKQKNVLVSLLRLYFQRSSTFIRNDFQIHEEQYFVLRSAHIWSMRPFKSETRPKSAWAYKTFIWTEIYGNRYRVPVPNVPGEFQNLYSRFPPVPGKVPGFLVLVPSDLCLSGSSGSNSNSGPWVDRSLKIWPGISRIMVYEN